MAELDPRTLIFIAGLLGLISTGMLFVLRRSFPPSIGGLGPWAAGCVAMLLASVLYGLTGKIPPLFSVVLASSLLVGGHMLGYVGFLQFSGRRANIRILLAMLCLVEAGVAWFTLVHDNFSMRAALVTSTNTVLLFATSHVVFAHNRRSLAGRFTGTVLAAIASISALRAGMLLLHLDSSTSVLDASTSQKFYLAALGIAENAITIGAIMMANERLRQTLEFIVAHDALSGAYSRATFLTLLQKELTRSQRYQRPLALLMFDLDNFKSINDRFGHQVGDRVIVDFSRRTMALFRQHDFFGRYGGEEFIAMLPETTLEDAVAIANRICGTIAASSSADLPHYTVSIGVAVAWDGEVPIDALLSEADKELYRAKENGRNRVEPVQLMDGPSINFLRRDVAGP